MARYAKKRSFKKYRPKFFMRGSGRNVRRARKVSRVGRGADVVHQYSRSIGATFTGAQTGLASTLNTLMISNSGVTEAGFCYTPAFQDISTSDFSTLYDQYKIWRVVLKFKLVNNPDATNQINTTAVGNASNIFPVLWLVPDHDDGTAPTIAQIKQYSRAKEFVLRPNAYVKYSFRPSTLTQLYNGVITTGYKVDKPGSTWVDMTNITLPHFGLKGAIDFQGYSAASNYVVKMEAKLYFGCKCVR